MTQKVLKVGSSAAATLPKDFLKRMGVKVGSIIEVGFNEKLNEISIRPAKKSADSEVLNWTKKFIKHYRPALKELAGK